MRKNVHIFFICIVARTRNIIIFDLNLFIYYHSFKLAILNVTCEHLELYRVLQHKHLIQHVKRTREIHGAWTRMQRRGYVSD